MTANRNTVFLKEMGVGPMWVRRNAAAVPVPDELPPIEAPAKEVQVIDVASSAWSDVPADAPLVSNNTGTPITPEVAEMDWGQLKAAVAACTKCGLCQNRKKTVFGVGDEKAKWLFVGEGPGRNEDIQGEPFVGPAGKLLDSMLAAMGLQRGDNAYIANIVKCRPTDADGRDRAPTQEEVAACMPYLDRQIALIQPAIIVALGKTAALSLLKLDPATPVSKLRGTVHRYADLPLVVTYHPAYLLRAPADKRKTWADLCLAMNTHAGSSS
jgi:uracil-DNA glycosylase